MLHGRFVKVLVNNKYIFLAVALNNSLVYRFEYTGLRGGMTLDPLQTTDAWLQPHEVRAGAFEYPGKSSSSKRPTQEHTTAPSKKSSSNRNASHVELLSDLY